MNLDSLYAELTLKPSCKLALIVLDGLGDLATREQGYVTPLEAARTPNLDALARDSAQGRMIPVVPGITPGSGPMYALCQKFGIPAVSIGVGNENSRNHAPNENIHLRDYYQGIEHIAVIIDRFNSMAS